ncbi:hypothetical protein [Haloglomus litoreum]|uniref:hypothetical protein n=1 Tax=Haloglomus litoreum TaxID=3034026 RepID=UPI0023E808B4|nr:hypothetical protein [Haloglomus sp. DT116]
MSIHVNEDNGLDEEAHYIGGIIKRVGEFSNRSLEGRKKFQKTIYLIQAAGIDLGYEYNWYVHGPYSPELARVGYRLEEMYEDVSPTKFSDEEIEGRFQEVLQFLDPIKDDVEKLEAAASLHWLSENNEDLPHDILIDYLLEEEKSHLDLTPEDCEALWDGMATLNIV